MSTIKVLTIDVVNKIAAGEVVERPASVVKELMENSIDAGSTSIRLDILQGGRHLIKVSDNGIGMDKEDAVNCIKRYATSKIKTDADLFNITSLGFRGEALAAIASVSKMAISTSLRGNTSGTFVEIHGGEIKNIKDTAHIGTSIEVRDLFYNVPARKKFLKTTSTELYHIMDTFTNTALSNFNINLTAFNETKELFNLPIAQTLQDRILQLYGADFLNDIVYFDTERNDVAINGFISKNDAFRRARSHQYLFINKRPIKDNYLRNAIYKAYGRVMPQEMHPLFFVYVNLDPQEVDFNVHPAKKEVRLLNKESIYNMLLNAVTSAIVNKDSVSVEYYHPANDIETGASYDKAYEAAERYSISPVYEPAELPYRTSRDYLYLGDVFVGYSDEDTFCVIDHHACHERILYEKLKNGVNLKTYGLLFQSTYCHIP
ncbi:DNA mismatch repair protein MutL [Candidatus Magnetoovum chiemensis]|nr:DNA mismatch repair protein MutL [Candidatus Magnetoovum chiemensis]